MDLTNETSGDVSNPEYSRQILSLKECGPSVYMCGTHSLYCLFEGPEDETLNHGSLVHCDLTWKAMEVFLF